MELVEHKLLHQNVPAKNIHIEKFVSIGDTEEAVEIGDATKVKVGERKKF